MFYISAIQQTAPESCSTALQQSVYQTLQALQIPYERISTDEAITMEDCRQINMLLDMHMVKTLFLCNRQQSQFYLFITPGDKPFRSKEFSHALGISRVSFAPVEKMKDLLHTKVGAATVFSALSEKAKAVQFVFDKDVVSEDWYGCSDGTTTGYMKIRTQDIIYKFLAFTGHVPKIIEV